MSSQPKKLLVHWTGEGEEGYSAPFRYPEILGALSAITGVPRDLLQPKISSNSRDKEESSIVSFANALHYKDGDMPNVKAQAFNEALQWVTISDDHQQKYGNVFTLQTFVKAAQRCALVTSMYEVVSTGHSFEELTNKAIENGGFGDMYRGGENEKSTWAVRVRQYGGEREEYGKSRRHSGRARSVSMEKDALLALKPMLLKFGGGVDLKNPDCKIYVFDGLEGQMALVRKVANGPRISTMAPVTRICVTTTPLEPIAAFSLCNIAGIRHGDKIFDPYSGSCAILLAASMIADNLQQVGVDSAHDGLINRPNILQDFSSRDLDAPKAVFRGDSTDPAIRERARAAVGSEPFDHIITDPPYGVREAIDAGAPSPLEEMFRSIKEDREQGKPLLKKGGKLVCFVPCLLEENLKDLLPNQEQEDGAGMKLLLSIEQPLNSRLSRWLVSYECIM